MMDFKNNSSIWFIIGGILLITAVAGSAAFFSNPTGNAILPGTRLVKQIQQVPQLSTGVHAIACDASQNCFMHNAQVAGTASAARVDAAMINANSLTTNSLDVASINGQGSGLFMKIGSPTTFDDVVNFNRYITVSDKGSTDTEIRMKSGTKTAYIVSQNGKIGINTLPQADLDVKGNIHAENILTQSIQINDYLLTPINTPLQVGSANPKGGVIWTGIQTGDLQAYHLGTPSGQGNAYACLDGIGRLFRSDTPCK